VPAWDVWKKGFDAWEQATARYLEQVLKSPAVLAPSGALLSAVMRTKAMSDRAVAAWWGAVGLPTKRDQERTLHRLNRIESRLLDLEEKLAEEDPRGDEPGR
jgi:Poly(R)-hydroxyalkanoic acid synthase subunit (PHA_synth_III_E)